MSRTAFRCKRCPINCLCDASNGDAIRLEHRLEVAAGVLAAPVAVQDQPGLLARMASKPRDAQRVDHDIARHVLAQRPAHYLTAEQVDHHRQEQPALIGRNVRDIPTQTLSGLLPVNSRFSTLVEIGRSWRLSVVTLKRRFPLARMP